MTVQLPLHQGTLTIEQWQLLESLARKLTPEQARWISGYFAGLDAGMLGAGSNLVTDVRAPQARTLTILYATETGNCRDLARDLLGNAARHGLEPTVADLSDYKFRQLKDEQDVLFIVSTH